MSQVSKNEIFKTKNTTIVNPTGMKKERPLNETEQYLSQCDEKTRWIWFHHTSYYEWKGPQSIQMFQLLPESLYQEYKSTVFEGTKWTEERKSKFGELTEKCIYPSYVVLKKGLLMNSFVLDRRTQKPVGTIVDTIALEVNSPHGEQFY